MAWTHKIVAPTEAKVKSHMLKPKITSARPKSAHVRPNRRLLSSRNMGPRYFSIFVLFFVIWHCIVVCWFICLLSLQFCSFGIFDIVYHQNKFKGKQCGPVIFCWGWTPKFKVCNVVCRFVGKFSTSCIKLSPHLNDIISPIVAKEMLLPTELNRQYRRLMETLKIRVKFLMITGEAAKFGAGKFIFASD